MNNVGRIQIFTDEPVIDYNNIIDVLRKAFSTHQTNAPDINFLLDYDAGIQPLQRKEPKKYRSDIDCVCIDNVAHEVIEFKLGFDWGNPITLVQRGEKDSGTQDEALAISLLNECYEAEKNKSKTQRLARFIEICGIGYTYVETKKKDDWEDGDSYFSLSVLDPRNAFIVYSSYYIDQRPMVGVSYRHDNKTGNNYFTCYTRESRFEIVNLHEIVNGVAVAGNETWNHDQKRRSGEKNPLGKIPIIEWIRSYDRTGAFEHQISECDNLNLMLSDFSNDVEQNTQAVWHTNDVEFPTKVVKSEDGTETEVVQTPKKNEWMQTYTSQDGKTPIVEALAVNYDYPGMLSNIQAARARILEKCDVPQRNDNSGGSTGVAMDSATGYTAAESAASKKQNIIEGCKMNEVAVALAAIRESLVIEQDNPLLKLRKSDVQPSIKRQKNFELTTKVNFFATAVSHGINGLHALKAMDAFEDINQVWEDSKPLIEAYQKSIFDKSNNSVGGEGEEKPNADRLEQDLSDQEQNSPFIGGTKTNNQ